MQMEKLFCDWQWGAMSIKNVVSVKTRKSDKKIKGHGNTQVYQLGVKFTGTSEISYRGEKIDFCAGTVLFLPKEKTEDIDYTTLTVEQGNGVCIFFESELPLSSEVQTLKNIGTDCEDAFLKLLNVYTKSDIYSYPEVMAAFYSLLSGLKKKSEPNNDEKRRGGRFDDVIAYMNRHIGDEYPDICRMARICGVSEKYFRDSFKKYFGITPLKYFHRLKTNNIKALIARLELPISDVAKMSGFSDPNYFSRFFKKQVGISPSEYRKYYCSGV